LTPFTETCRKEEPPAKVNEIDLDLSEVVSVLTVARGVCGVGPSTAVLTELQLTLRCSTGSYRATPIIRPMT
jgi:hypothetical protein